MANKKKGLSKLQIARRATQLAFTGLLIAGLYYDIRIVIMLLIPATLVFGTSSVDGYVHMELCRN